MQALIIDPSLSYRRILASVVRDAGFKAVTTSAGVHAFELLKQQSFDVVFTAMHLEDMEGSAFASHLRADSDTHQMPLIMLTSVEDEGSLMKVLALGVTEVLSKTDLDKISEYLVLYAIQHGETKMLSGHVLYIEDSESIASMVTALLNNKGLVVDHYVTAEKALEALQAKNYDLVLTDIVLEGKMSGYGLVREIRGWEGQKSQVPILALSGYKDEARKIELLRSGANDYISKPVLDEELLVRVTNLITNRKLIDKITTQQERLHDMAMKDQLTGLYNRHFLMESAPKKLSEACRHKIPYSLIVMDLDKFKSINDTHGHQKGDEVLVAVSKIIFNACRQEDIPARFGGE